MLLYETNHVRIKMKQNRSTKKVIAWCAALVLLVGTVGATIAWLTATTNPITNTFDPSHVSCEVEEQFNENTGLKEHVQIKNTSDIPAYIRVRLVSYNKDGDMIIGGAGKLPSDDALNFADWVQIGSYYYCKTPIDAGQPTPELITSYQLEDGQVLEILAEAIQSEPTRAVSDAWNITIGTDGTITG